MSRPSDLLVTSAGWAVLLAACGGALAIAILDVGDAVRTRDEQSGITDRLRTRWETRLAVRSGPAGAPAAPASAFLTAGAAGAAAARLADIVSARAAAVDLTVLSAHAPASPQVGTAVLQATLTGSLGSLQDLLHDLETGTPFLFVEGLTISTEDATRAGTEPRLRIALTVRATWRDVP